MFNPLNKRFNVGIENVMGLSKSDLPGLFALHGLNPFCEQGKISLLLVNVAEWLLNMIDSNAYPFQFPCSQHQIHKSELLHCERCCLFGWQNNFP